MYDLFIDPPASLVPRHLRLEVSERVRADGGIARPLDEAGARAAIAASSPTACEAIAICLLHAYRNPVHERSSRPSRRRAGARSCRLALL
mgnify:CR=1 FL=1